MRIWVDFINYIIVQFLRLFYAEFRLSFLLIIYFLIFLRHIYAYKVGYLFVFIIISDKILKFTYKQGYIMDNYIFIYQLLNLILTQNLFLSKSLILQVNFKGVRGLILQLFCGLKQIHNLVFSLQLFEIFIEKHYQKIRIFLH